MPKLSLWKNSSDTIWPIAREDETVHTFVKGISLKTNVVERLEIELAD